MKLSKTYKDLHIYTHKDRLFFNASGLCKRFNKSLSNISYNDHLEALMRSDGSDRTSNEVTLDNQIYLTVNLLPFISTQLDADLAIESLELTQKLNTLRPKISIESLLEPDVQKRLTRQVNELNIKQGGVTKAADWNRQNCINAMSIRPSDARMLASSKGLPYRNRKSGRQAVRSMSPTSAAVMAMADWLALKGLDATQALATAKSTEPYFKFLTSK